MPSTPAGGEGGPGIEGSLGISGFEGNCSVGNEGFSNGFFFWEGLRMALKRMPAANPAGSTYGGKERKQVKGTRTREKKEKKKEKKLSVAAAQCPCMSYFAREDGECAPIP